jgi:hypothetical protein
MYVYPTRTCEICGEEFDNSDLSLVRFTDWKGDDTYLYVCWDCEYSEDQLTTNLTVRCYV